MTTWDERFREGEYPRDPDPSPVLRDYVSEFPDGGALDVATGTGRNAVFLAEAATLSTPSTSRARDSGSPARTRPGAASRTAATPSRRTFPPTCSRPTGTRW